MFLAVSLPLLAGCSATVVVDAAPDSNNPDCAEVMVRLPEEIGEAGSRYTSSQATKAWGDPSSVIFRCGIEPVEASALPCVSAGEVDWLVDDSAAPLFRFISFGRDPAVEVIVDSENASGIGALEAIAPAVSVIEPNVVCTTIEE